MSHIEDLPLLLRLSELQYSGFVKILGKSYKVCITLPGPGDPTTAVLECEWKLQHKIRHQTDVIMQRLQSSENIAAFFKDFLAICESCMKTSAPAQLPWSDVSGILQQIQDVGWERVHSLNLEVPKIELFVNDNAGRQHILGVTFDRHDISSMPVCSVDLPEKFSFHWSRKSGLKHLYLQLEAAVSSYQAFWNVLREIDDQCWVLEPENPSFSSNYRRIALGPNISLYIVVNCRQPESLPECRLLGAESVVADLRERLNVNLHRWDVERSLLKNLEEVLDMDFPSPSTTNKEDLSVDCGICYCHNINDEVPDVVCEEQRCGQAFHKTCLVEWLRSLSSRQSFNTLFGDCPLCSHPIRVKLLSS